MSWRLSWVPMLALLAWPAAGAAEDRPPIVAVFNVEVKGLKLAPDVVDRLTDYLAGRMGQGGRFQVVPRDMLKSRLVQQKKASYSECYAQSCQIELGQELAADKTLATQVIKLGSQCKVNLSIFDLKRTATENSATASGPCTEDGIVAALEAAHLQLIGGEAPEAPVVAPATRPTAPPATAVRSAAPDVDDAGPRVKKAAVTAAVGDLTIQAKTPSGAAVRLEITDPTGRSTVSGSPFKEPAAKVGVWKVVAKARDHEAEEREVRVPPDDVTFEKIELKPLGSLSVTGDPPGAAVKVRGPGGFSDDGGLPWEAEGLRSGTYRIEVSRTGYVTDSRAVTVEPGQRAAATVRLQKEAPAAAPDPGRAKGYFGGNRFVVTGDEVLDRSTGLVWQQGEDFLHLPAAKALCAGRSPRGAWRLPTSAEMVGVVKDGVAAGVFKAHDVWFWTSDPHRDGNVPMVGFEKGNQGTWPAANMAGIRCVKGP